MGMTQKELAEKMGVKEQQVQRDEANQYSSDEFQLSGLLDFMLTSNQL